MPELTAVTRSYVVTGGAQGVGRTVVERLLADGHAVVVLDLDPAALTWTTGMDRIVAVAGNAADETVTERAASSASELGSFAGWVNNAAVFRDAKLHADGASVVLELITANLAPALTGAATAIRRFLSDDHPGSIVNVSSHQAQRPVRGALPYASAKAAIEGLTRALAVDYGPRGIRVNAVALGSIETERYRAFLASQSADSASHIEKEMGRLHPLGRVGRAAEVAATIAFLLSDESSFINGAVLPVDGGRAAWGPDPEES